MGKIEIKMTSDASKPTKDVEALERKVEELSKSYDAAGKASVKAAKGAEGSFSQLERELKDNLTALKRMEVGSKQFEDQRKKVAGLTKELNTAKGAIAGVATKGEKLQVAAGNTASKIAGVAAGFFSINAAVQAISAEFDKIKRNQLQAAAQTRTFEESLADIAFNVGGENLDATRQMVEANAAALGTSQGGLANLIGLAISAGAKDIEQALSVATSSLKATAGDAEKATELVQSALDIASLAGSQNFSGALGQVSQTAQQVRATSPSEFFSNLGPALATATANRDNIDAITTERTLELSAVVSQIIKDRSGANTATTMRQFITRLDSFSPERTAKLEDGSKSVVPREVLDAFKATRNVDERINLFRQNEGLRRQFLDQQKEGIGKSAIAEIITGTERALGFEAKASAAILNIDEAEKSFNVLTAAVDRNTVNLRADRMVQSAIQKAQTQGDAGLQGQARKIVDDAIAQVNLPGLDALQEFALGTEFTAAQARGENFATFGLQALDTAATRDPGFGKRSLDDQERQIVDAAKEQLRILEPLIESARLQAAQQNQANGFLQEIAAAAQQNQANGFLKEIAAAANKPQRVVIDNAGPVESPPAAAGVP